MPLLIRITTVPVSMQVLLKGQMKFMQEQGFEVVMISSDGPEVKALEAQEQCRHITVPFTRKISPVQDLVCLVKLIRIFRKLKPDIVHTHTPKAGLLGMWAAWISGVPIRLHTIAGLPWVETTGFMRKLLRFVEKLTATPASRIYPNSMVQQRFLEQQHIALGKMKVLGKGSSNGINSKYFSVDENIQREADQLLAAENVQPGAWIWVFIGRLVKDKGIGEMLDAFTEINSRYPGDRLWLLGEEEPELDPLNEQQKELLKNSRFIRCWGFQKDIRPYLAASKILVFPSYREGFPNVPLQAGSMGCMLLLSDINGCNEIVENGINGTLVPPKNTEALLSAMLAARKDPATTDRFAKAIQLKIRTNYDQQQLWNILLDEYRQWLKQKGRLNA